MFCLRGQYKLVAMISTSIIIIIVIIPDLTEGLAKRVINFKKDLLSPSGLRRASSEEWATSPGRMRNTSMLGWGRRYEVVT